MAKYRYFTLEELLRSDTAKRRGIDNTPTFEVVDHLNELTENILEPLRAAYGRRIFVMSGYRSEALNKAVGGSATSAHLTGYAADLRADNMDDFKAFVREWLVKQRVRFDQCIIEKKGNVEWIHIGFKNNYGQQRGQVFIMVK